MKKLVAIVTSCLLAVTALVACGGEKKNNDLENVKAKGQLVVGMECAYAPYNWAQANETEYTVKINSTTYADGYDVQIAKKIAEKLGVELVIKPIEWDGLLTALESGQIDMVCAGMSPTAERKMSADFTDTYFDSNLVMVIKNDSAYKNATKISDFSGAKITGQMNTFHYAVIDQIDGVNKQTALPDFAALMQALKSGSVDGYVCEKPGAVSAVAANPEFTYIEFADGNGFTCNPEDASIAIGIRKGSNLAAEFNSVINSLSKAEKESMMDAAIARQPKAED